MRGQIIKEAIDDLEHGIEIGNIIFQMPGDEHILAVLKLALEKQTPIKVQGLELTEGVRIGNKTIREGCKIYNCECGMPVGKSCKYCPECGQRLKII